MTVFDAITLDWGVRDKKKSGDPSLRSPGLAFELVKRAIDLGGALFALLLLGPILLGCGLWIRWADGGPVFYRQWRVGRDGKLFRIWKLRTMRVNAEAGGAQFAQDNDPRVIRGCRWIRKSHLDELPQLLNIIRGEMTLVGPRPERPELMEQMAVELPGLHRRLLGTPGLTGLAQVRNGYTNDLAGMQRKLDLDLQYLRERSIWLDLRLIAKTLPHFWDRHAC
ncbi:MAG: sugar transferase [Planctomycetota bacterium]